MRKNVAVIIASILTGIAGILAAICLFRFTALKNQINFIQSDITTTIESNFINSLSVQGYVVDKFDKWASLLADSRYEYGSVDADHMTAEIFFSVTPKKFSPEETTAVLIWNDMAHPLTLDNGAFTTSLIIPIFARNDVIAVQLTEAGVTHTEILNWNSTPRYWALPEVYTWLEGEPSSYDEDNSSCHVVGTVNVKIAGLSAYSIQSAELIEILDGNEIRRMPIQLTKDAGNLQDYMAQPFYYFYYYQKVPDTAYLGSYDLDETYQVPSGCAHEFYVEVVDGYGFCYRKLIDYLGLTEDGHVLLKYIEKMQLADVYDSTGNLLYMAYR